MRRRATGKLLLYRLLVKRVESVVPLILVVAAALVVALVVVHFVLFALVIVILLSTHETVHTTPTNELAT